jgi:hypothetical protein
MIGQYYVSSLVSQSVSVWCVVSVSVLYDADEDILPTRKYCTEGRLNPPGELRSHPVRQTWGGE